MARTNYNARAKKKTQSANYEIIAIINGSLLKKNGETTTSTLKGKITAQGVLLGTPVICCGTTINNTAGPPISLKLQLQSGGPGGK